MLPKHSTTKNCCRSESSRARTQQKFQHRGGLLRKAYEYSIYCDSDVYMVLQARSSGQIFAFISDSSKRWAPSLRELTKQQNVEMAEQPPWYSPQTNIIVQIDATLNSLDDVNHPSRVIGGAFSDRSTPAVDRRGYPQRKNCSCAFSGSQPLFGLPFVTQADPYEPSHDAYKLAFYHSLAQSPEGVGISPHAHVTGDESRSSCLPLSSPMNPDASDISSSYAAIKTEPLELPQDPLSPSQPTPDADRILESVATPPEVYKSRALGPKCQENSPRPRENDRPNFAGIPVDSRGSKAFGLESAHRIYTGELLADAAVATIQHCSGKPVMENFSDVLPVYLSSWLSNEQEGHHPLSLPEIRLSSLQATCTEYFKALRAKTDTDTFKDNIHHHTSQVLLFLCFEAFVRELQEKERSGTLVVKHANHSMSTIVWDLIMEAIYPNEYKGSRKKFYQDALNNHTQYGSHW
ncbi:uncharacterized protein CIMG_12567 [Coccidioides immitis RS]|uniref:MADS-box domain-containing protein n=1 Tax=Coccidioides immitis (strain RS) TaxID=246410 RepID=J3K091_COCIM|nr:uncharacterized protein CIMG_12567 [Coccidioides immitis RS]EAS27241.3 hypothetical protein CIMG_12567 [Coccidioides immitis RS]